MRRRLDEGVSLSEVLDVDFIATKDMARLRLLADYRNLRETMALTGVAARNAILGRVKSTARTLDFAGLALVALSFSSLILAVYLTATELSNAAR